MLPATSSCHILRYPQSLKIKFRPDRAVVGWPIHSSQVVVDSSIAAVLIESFGSQNQSDPQTPFRFPFEAARAVVEPAEAIRHLRIDTAVGIPQTPSHHLGQPLPFFRQKARFSTAQPTVFVVFTDTDIGIQRSDIHIPQNHQVFLWISLDIEPFDQVAIKTLFVGKFFRVLAVFPLGKVTVDNPQAAVLAQLMAGNQQAALVCCVFIRITPVQLLKGQSGEGRDPEMAFLAMMQDLIAQLLQRLMGEFTVMNLGFLQADYVRLMFFYQRLQLMKTSPQPVDVERKYFHTFSLLTTHVGQNLVDEITPITT